MVQYIVSTNKFQSVSSLIHEENKIYCLLYQFATPIKLIIESCEIPFSTMLDTGAWGNFYGYCIFPE